MLPLIPLALSIAPELARWLFGDKAEATAAAVTAAISQVTGTPDSAAAQAVLSRDPQAAATLRVELARIAAAAETSARDADLASLQAELRDVADARAQTVALVQAHSAVQWAPAIVSLVVLGTFGVVMWATLTRVLPDGSQTVVNLLLGTLAAMASSVVAYWVGSSAGSAAKTQLLFQARAGARNPGT